MEEKKSLLTIPEASELLNLGKNTVYKLVKQGKIPTVKWSQKILIPRAALERMLADTAAKCA